MQAIQDGRVAPGLDGESQVPIVPYDLTSQDRIIRGQMPTLDAINDRIASLFGRSLGGRLRLDARVSSGAATLLKFADVQALLAPPTTVGIVTLGGGHGLGAILLEGNLANALLAGALGDRKARPEPARGGTERSDLTNVERLVLRHLLGLMAEAMSVAWADVLAFRPEVLRFESDPRMAVIAPASDVAILCPFELTGTLTGRLQLVLPYAAVEPAKKLLASPPRLGGGSDGDARFSAALARELSEVDVEVRVEIGRRTLNLSELLSLDVGNVLTLNTNEGAPLPVYVEGRLKATGAPRVVSGSMAISLEGPIGAVSGKPEKHPPTAGDGSTLPYRPAA